MRCLAFIHDVVLFFALFGGLYSAHSFAQDQKGVELNAEEKEALAFVGTFPKISIGFSVAPGFGHAATGVQVMKRLRELGYEGEFEIYVDQASRVALAKLLPEYQVSGAVEQTLSNLHATTHELKRKKIYEGSQVLTRKKAIQTLGIMGADDEFTSPQALNVDALLVMQPPGWEEKPSLRIQHSSSYVVIPLPEGHLKPLRTSEVSPATLLRVPGLKTVIDHLELHEVLTAYGLGLRKGEEKLNQIVNASKIFQHKNPELSTKRGTVVLMISNLNESEWARFHELSPSTKVLALNHEHLETELIDLKFGEVLVIKVGSQPQDIWDALMLQSTLPPTVSGNSGVNFLSARGIPFVHTTGPVHSDFQGLLAPLFSQTAHWLETGDEASLAHFFADARTPDSAVAKIFARQESLLEGRGDKLMSVLQESMGWICNEVVQDQAPTENGDKKPLQFYFGLKKILKQLVPTVLGL